jgi:Domain of unknown function (DUF6457)
VSDWLEETAARVAAAAGDDASAYALTDDDKTALLDLARVAARDSGERMNAPLLTYLAGLAHARHPELSLDDLVDAAVGKS